MPRSPSRDLSDRYIGKRGYFRRPDAIRRWKYVLAAAAFAASVGWAAVDLVQPARVVYAHTHGPLAGPHAAFDDNCAACHVSQTFDFNPLSVFGARDRWHNLSCGKCHAGPNDAGFAHHASATDDAREFHKRCSNCHHDHNGRLNSLVRHPDADCNRCHGDLAKWHHADQSLTKAKGEPPYQNAITGFATDHPEFRSLDRAPPRTLKFSHAFHMDPGLSAKMTLPDLDARFGAGVGERYRKPGQTDDAVRLQCASCHTLDSGTGTPQFDALKQGLTAAGQPARAFLPPRADGAYFQPVSYELSCRACHPLQAPAQRTEGAPDTFVKAFDVAHGKQPTELVADLEAGYLKRLLAEKHPKLAERPTPGGPPDRPNPAAQALNAEVARLTAGAKNHLFTEAPKAPPGRPVVSPPSCAKCHDTGAPVAGTALAMRVERVPDRTVWFTHAKFNHSAHRGTTCATCHPGTATAYAPGAALVEKEPVKDNILGLKACQACHAPAGSKVTVNDAVVSGGGVRHNCTDCHRYHHGDLPMQGRGAASRFPKEPRELADWLKGK